MRPMRKSNYEQTILASRLNKVGGLCGAGFSPMTIDGTVCTIRAVTAGMSGALLNGQH